jgi:glycosyltransferase involved in cell wall biosynthesis
MKILYHHRTMGDGAEGIHIREIVSALRSLGHEVRVVALAGDPTQSAALRSSGAAKLRRVIPSAAYEIAEIAYNMVGYRRLMEAIRQFSPDVIYDRYNSYSTAALKAARRARLPLLLEVNAPIAYERSVYEHLPLKFPRLATRYERTIFAGADRIFVVSTPLKAHLTGALAVDPQKIVVLPNAADPDVFTPVDGSVVRRRYAIEDRFVIGFVGILRPWHGLDLLLDAFATFRQRWPTGHLLIVGDGPVQEALESSVRERRLESWVTFTGRLQQHDVVAHVAAMDVTVSPRATFYASPMKILEYMSMGKPVVAPDMDNIRDIIDHGGSGWLFPPEDLTHLVKALETLAHDEQLRRDLGRCGRRRVLEQFNWRGNARRIADEASRLAADFDGRSRLSGVS